MKHYKIRTIPETTRKELDKVTCDKCTKDIKTLSGEVFEYDWFKMKTGSVYFDGGSMVEYKMDLCQSCSEKAIEILKDNGFDITERDLSY